MPRALFTSGVGREPRYHIAIDEIQEWTYLGEKLGPLKGFPGVVWTGSENWSDKSEVNDEVTIMIPRQKAHEDYARHFEFLWKRHTRRRS